MGTRFLSFFAVIGLILAGASVGRTQGVQATIDFGAGVIEGERNGFLRVENAGVVPVDRWMAEVTTVDMELRALSDRVTLLDTRIEGETIIRVYQIIPMFFNATVEPGQLKSIWLFGQLTGNSLEGLEPGNPWSIGSSSASISQFRYLERVPTEVATYRVDDALVTITKEGDWEFGALLKFDLSSATDQPIYNWHVQMDLTQTVANWVNCRYTDSGSLSKTVSYVDYLPGWNIIPAGDVETRSFWLDLAYGGIDILPLVTRVFGSDLTAQSANKVAKVLAPETFVMRGSSALIQVKISNARRVSVKSTGKRRVGVRLGRVDEMRFLSIRGVMPGRSRVTVFTTDRKGRQKRTNIWIIRQNTI